MINLFGNGDPKKKKKEQPYDLDAELKQSYNKVMTFDNKPAIEIVRTVGEKSGVDPALLFSSAYQEGMNKAILKPDEVSEAYLNAQEKEGLDTNKYPVDGFYNYGLDTFGDQYERLKKYLPEGFEERFKTFKGKNEKNETITTAAFMTNEDALLAKTAFIKDIQDQIKTYSEQNNIQIDPADINYFTLAAYNGGVGRAKTMLKEYAAAKDKRKFIDLGGTTKKEIHQNISPRLKRMKLINELLNPQTPATNG